MRTLFIIAVFILCSVPVSIMGQDTICFRNKTCVAAIIKEVGIKQIAYKRWDVPQGALYIVNKNELERIRFANGHVDTYEAEKPLVSETIMETDSQRITYDFVKRNTNILTDIADRNPPLKRDELYTIATKIRKLKSGQAATTAGTIVFGVATGGAIVVYMCAMVLNLGNPPDNIFAIPPAAFAISTAALLASNITISVKLRQERLRFIEVFNR